MDRTQEKLKQIAQSKQITRQRRKGLSDLFKMLPNLGLNYKRGLMELTLETELVDYSIKPFNLTSLPIHDCTSVKETININYAKCAFRLKILRNIMLTPLAELGPPNIDRIKGFTSDMFIIMQKQRRSLSDCVGTVHELNNIIKKIEYIIVENNGFSQSFARSKYFLNITKPFIYKSMSIFEQLIALLNLAPSNVEKANYVAYTNDDQIDGIKSKCVSILKQITNAKSLYHTIDIDFPRDTAIEKLQMIKNSILNDIKSMLDEYSTLPLLRTVNQFINSQNCLERKTPENGDHIACIDNEMDDIIHKMLLSFQKLYKQNKKMTSIELPEDVNSSHIEPDLLSVKMYSDLTDDWSILNANEVLIKLQSILQKFDNSEGIQFGCINTLYKTLPILKQYHLVLIYFVQQQLASHHATVNTLNILLGVFVTLSTKGFCIPPDLVEDQNENEENLQKGEGFGLEDGTGEKDASDKLESEDQLENAKKPEDHKNEEQNDCKEEKGVEMTDNFDANQQDIDKPENQEDDSGDSDNDSELDKEMGETENDAEKLDDQIWGDDEEKEEDKEEDFNNDEGKGSSKENDIHNDFDQQKSENENLDTNERLDATESESLSDKEKKKNDVSDKLEDESNNEEQSNSIHNNLEEPPEPESMELGELDMMNTDDDNKQDNVDESDPFDIGKLFYF